MVGHLKCRIAMVSRVVDIRGARDGSAPFEDRHT